MFLSLARKWPSGVWHTRKHCEIFATSVFKDCCLFHRLVSAPLTRPFSFLALYKLNRVKMVQDFEYNVSRRIKIPPPLHQKTRNCLHEDFLAMSVASSKACSRTFQIEKQYCLCHPVFRTSSSTSPFFNYGDLIHILISARRILSPNF